MVVYISQLDGQTCTMKRAKVARYLLKRDLTPMLKAEGFSGQFPHFQRQENDKLHLLSIEFDRYGGGFFLEFAAIPAGEMQTSWGEAIPQDNITLAHTNIEIRARLQQTAQQNSLRENWFCYDNLSEQEIEDLVDQVASMIGQVNDWLRHQNPGQNISATNH